MEGLKSIFQQKLAFINEKISAGLAPTPVQLKTFLEELNGQVGQVIRNCSPQVQRLVRRKFANIGWDCKLNRPVVKTPPTITDIQSFLTQTLQEMKTCQPAVVTETVTREELDDLSKACKRLWNLDSNRLHPGVDYELNLQYGKKIYQQGDRATEPLFTRVSPEVFQRPTFRRFAALLDNYERATGQAEVITQQEIAENHAFIHDIMETHCMKYCHKYLHLKGLAPASEQHFKAVLEELWFTLYRRKTNNDSSGFEHVFVGESKEGEITGLHNWIQLYLEERRGALDYQGYIYPKVCGGRNGFSQPLSTEQMISLQFVWDGELKKCSSSFIGVSPEFEVALFTMCFLAGSKENIVECGPYRALITCFSFNSRGRTYIGTVFPSEAPLNEEEAAVKIQSVIRGKQCRRQGAQAYQDRKTAYHAATHIQSAFRGSKARKAR
mmetsp:Transcript_19723/g.25492  ORF Transcript_19723/g.25492 Transcript_19723/m.25492 type:complete len:439 (+) Transcript_19723:123-1439(+)